MELQKYQRATANELDSILLRIGMVKSQPTLFPEIYDNEGNIISADQLSKANELTGAGIEYITSVCEYAYTNFLTAIRKKRNSNPLYDTLPAMDWDAFLEIASGGMPGQMERIQRTIMQYQAKPKTVLMIDSTGNLHSRWPFVLDFEWEGTGKLDGKKAAQFARLNSVKKAPKIDPDTSEIIPRLPIKKITIMAAKPLFEAFFKKDPSTYSFPTGMYAKMFYLANNTKKQLSKDIPGMSPFKYQAFELIDNDIYVSAYTRFARYIMRHNNLTSTQMKNKNHCSTISFPLDNFIKSVYPSLIHIDGKGKKYIDVKNYLIFMRNAQFAYLSLTDFLIYPVLNRRENDRLIFDIFTDQNKAQNKLLEYDKRRATTNPL